MTVDLPPDPATGLRIARVLIFGPVNSGKTTLGATLVRDMVPPGMEEAIICVGPNPKLANLLKVTHHPLSTTDLKAQEAFFRDVLDEPGVSLTVIDEADLYFSQAGRTYGSKALQELLNIGRGFGKSLVLIARGTSDVAKNAIANSQAVYMARTTEPNLLEYAERWFRDVPEPAEYISNLEPHEFLVWCPQQIPKWQGTAKVVNGKIWIVPPEETPETSEATDESGEATSPGDAASTPAAEGSSPTDGEAPSAETTIPNGSGNRPG